MKGCPRLLLEREVNRRKLLTSSTVFASLAVFGTGCSRIGQVGEPKRLGDDLLPSLDEWEFLKEAVGGRLSPGAAPQLASAEAAKLYSSPLYLGDQPGLTQSSGWLDAWTSSPSAYVVRAKDASDVAAAVRFARAYKVRLVVKGGGHSYHGGSNAPNSLLVWTRDMEAIEIHDAFVPNGSDAAPAPAVSVGAGCLWGRVYDVVTTRHGRYVQGGGCTTVGVAGLVLGGGFGSFSKGFGLAAASLLEAEIVTADGEVRIVNNTREPDLFWALKGGGGGTFGIVTRLTLRTHDLPAQVGSVGLTIKANSDTAFRRLMSKFVETYATKLHSPHWGEQARAYSDNRFVISMMCQGIDEAEARAAFAEFNSFIAASPSEYKVEQPFRANFYPMRILWDQEFLSANAPQAIKQDTRAGARSRDFWWAGDGEQAGAFWWGYQSAWLPTSLIEPHARDTLVNAWFEASRIWTVSFHFNKGLAGASPDTLAASRDTSMNPQVLEAFALAIIAGEGPCSFPPLAQPDRAAGRRRAAKIRSSMIALRQCAPHAGNYVSECDYFNDNWLRDSWGGHADRLAQIKRLYDPDGLFIVHHGVGSE